MKSDKDGCDVVTFTLKLESSAESFWKLLKRSKNYHVSLSSFEVICSIKNFLLEDDVLSESCVTKYRINSKVLRVSKKELRTYKNEKNHHTALLSNVFTNVDIKDEESDNEHFKQDIKCDNISTDDELNRKDITVGTSELVRQALLQAADIPDFTDNDISSASIGKEYQKSVNQEKRYACSICQKTFLRPYLVRKHLETAHNKKEMLQKGEQYIIVKSKGLKELLPYVCSLCGKKFKEKRYLHNHYKFHVGQKRFACKICSRDFLWLCHTKKHVKDVHNKDDVIKNIDLYIKKLMPLDNGSNSAIVGSCKGSFENKEQKTSFSCNHCDKRFNQKRILKVHLLQKHSFGSDLPNIKTLPKEYSKHRTKLNCTVQTLNEKTAFPPPGNIHDKSVNTSDEMIEGIIQHSQLEVPTTDGAKASFSCSYCEKCFTEKILAELHIFLTHEQDRLDTLTDENGQYTCPICEKKIGAKRNFKAHLHIHVKERYFICTVCNKSFLWHSCATRHVKTHGLMDVNQYMKMVTSDNLFSEKITCVEQRLKSERGMKGQRDESLEAFYHRDDLNAKVVDNGAATVEGIEAVGSPDDVREKPGCTVCTRCCRGFMTHVAWQEHMKTCLVQNQYKCLLCMMPFPTKCSAHRHLRRVHNKESDETDHLVEVEASQIGHAASVNDPEGLVRSECHFMCSVCKKFFRERRYLRQHMWTHRRQWMHRCKHCARYFTKKQFLQEHMTNRHPLGNLRNAKTVVKNDCFQASVPDISDSHLCAVCGDPNADITPEGHMCLPCKDNRTGGDIFTCGVCGIKMKNRHDLVVHSRTHEVREHKCDVCSKVYKQKKLLDIHKKEHSGEKPFCCETCGLRFASSERLRFHNYNVHSERLRRNAIKFYASSLCPVCDICEDDDDDMYTYFLDDPFVRTTLRGISVGRIGTRRKEYVSMHYVSCECEDDDDDMYTYFLDDPFVRTTLRGISVGRIGTRRKEYVSMHYVSCERVRIKDQMWNHLSIHSGMFELNCNYCDKFFTCAEELSTHGQSLHTNTDMPFTCYLCEITFSEKAKLLEHFRIHPEKEIHSCTQCSNTFYLKADLREHIKSKHERKKRNTVQEQALAGVYRGPFPCKMCGRVYQKKASLDIHMKIHYGIFDFPCDFCEKKFKSAAECRIHRRQHTKEKPYQCPYCGEHFNRHSTLTQHKRRHTDERPYLCDDCGMAFRTRKTLQNHKMTHTKNTGVSQKPVPRAPPKLLPTMNDRNIPLSQHIELPQQIPMMHQPDVSHYYSYWNVQRQ